MTNGKATAAALAALLALGAGPAAAEKPTVPQGLPPCPPDMVEVGSWCVDKFEASVWSRRSCQGTQYGRNDIDDYTSAAGCRDNGSGCLKKIYACSLGPNTTKPSVNINWFQAAMACSNSGKELLPNAVWQTAALGTPDPGIDNKICNVTNYATPAKTGALPKCVSAFGAFDMGGNVWELVADWGTSGGGHKTNPPGTAVEIDGTAEGYGNDAIWNVGGQASSEYHSMDWTLGLVPAILRGGGWTDGDKAGTFYWDSFGSTPDWDFDVGFRCGRRRL